MGDTEATTVALIGLGNMGIPMAVNIASAGFTVIGWDIDPASRQSAAEQGVTAAADICAAAAADIVVLMLPNSRIVESVVHDNLLNTMRPGSVLVDMGSSEPLSTQALAAELNDRGIDMVDAPVSGGVKGAVAGTLTVMAGGETTTLDRVEPVLLATGRVTRTGGVGSGHALKALNNLLSATHLLASSEALEAGRRFGLDIDVMLEVINASSGKSWSTEFKWPTFIVNETYNSGFGLRLLAKDVRIATDLARELGLPSRLGEASLALWEQAAQSLPSDADHTEIARFAAKGESE